MKQNVDKLFPYKSIRSKQKVAIDFALDAVVNGKKWIVIEAGTGTGKSAIGLTVARCIYNNDDLASDKKTGAYFLTTQKILQAQYMKDFGGFGKEMKSVKSSTNYTCNYNKTSNCGENQRALKATDKSSGFWKACSFNCVYKKAKQEFLDSKESVTNFPYYLAETYYSGKLEPRKVLVIDEAHNISNELSKFIEVTISEKFCNAFLDIKMPDGLTQAKYIDWISNAYIITAKKKMKHFEQMLEKYIGLKSKMKTGDFASISKKYEMLDKHICKVSRFLELYNKENWVMNIVDGSNRSSKKIEFKPIDVAPYSAEMLFDHADHIILMSATIIDKDAFAESTGIPKEEMAFISIPSPFPVENRPVIFSGVGKMNASSIQGTLPNLVQAVKMIMEQHKNDKGIIHAHSYSTAKYIKDNIKSRRILIHGSDNRDEILEKHKKSKTPTILLSPSMTEGVDLKGDLSRFQIICKVPYPYLGDKLVKKKMHKWKWWYPLQTTKTILQSVGRSIRTEEDTAVTYILDSDFERFYNMNKNMFPEDFRRALKK